MTRTAVGFDNDMTNKETTMRRWLVPLCVLLAAVLALPAPAKDEKDAKNKDDGFKPLFDGKTLDGWVKVNNAPGTFSVKDGQIVTTGLPIGFMRTARMYENFILELEWKHVPPTPKEVGNSGVFVWADPLPAVGSPFTRGIEVQVLVNLEYRDKKSGKVTATSHGDLFSIWGATCVPDRPHPLGWARCLPSENRAKGAGEWNHYRVEAKDGVIKLAVNGKVVSGVSKCVPRKGYLALEAEGSECRFRNLKIKELPSTNPKPEEVAQQGQEFVTLFTGLGLDGWKVDDDQKKHWQAQPGPNVLRYAHTEQGSIATAKEYGDFELVCDCRLPKKGGGASILLRGSKVLTVDLSQGKPGAWGRYTVTCTGNKVRVSLGKKDLGETTAKDAPGRGPIQLQTNGPAEFCNLFIRQLK
jgi:hypothetical protein